jgi:Ni/Co efflux regulator RcnB
MRCRFEQGARPMKKALILSALLAATLAPVAAQAGSSPRELQRDRREISAEKQDLRQAKRHGNRGDIRDARGEVREAKQEYREDWRDYRTHNRNAFHPARFRAPFRYNNFNIGIRLSPQYYGSRYYVNNYSSYRLPSPGYGLRYVRHYNDVLLVNVRNGRVVQVYRNFYW